MGRLIRLLSFAFVYSVQCAAQQSSVLFFRKDPSVPVYVWTRMSIFHNKEKIAVIKRNNVAIFHPNQEKTNIHAKIVIPNLFARYYKSDEYNVYVDNKITFIKMRVKYRIFSGVKIKFGTLTSEQFKNEYATNKKLRKKLAKAKFPTINSLYEISH